MFQMTFILIAYFDWLLGPKQGKFSKKKIYKNLLLRNCLIYEADTLHTCFWHYPLQKKLFLFQSDKNSGCYGNFQFP